MNTVLIIINLWGTNFNSQRFDIFYSTKILDKISSLQDTTTVSYWKERALAAERELKRQTKIAVFQKREALNQQNEVNYLMRKSEELIRTIDEQKKLIQEYKTKIKN